MPLMISSLLTDAAMMSTPAGISNPKWFSIKVQIGTDTGTSPIGTLFPEGYAPMRFEVSASDGATKSSLEYEVGARVCV